MRKRSWRNFDWLLLAVTIAIVGIGVALIYSATISTEADIPLWERSFVRQAVFGVSGLFILILAAAMDYRVLGRMGWLLYAAALLTLGIVAAWGQIGFGAQSWLSLRRAIQPSELAKVLLIVFLAKYLGDHEEKLGDIRWVLLSAVLLAPVVYLLYRQPDMGTAMVFAAIWLGLVFAAGMRWWQMGLFSVAAAVATPVAWALLKDYMQERVRVFLNPASDVSGISYNTRQALISIGSGGWFGKGFLKGTQSQLYFLRVRHTDYVFSVLCEELGFVGALVLLLLLVILLWRVLRVASMAADPLGRLLACGVAAMILFQSFVNIGVNVGLLPVTGLTLPLVSYGGSSLWATLLGIGLVESVAMRHRRLDFGD